MPTEQKAHAASASASGLPCSAWSSSASYSSTNLGSLYKGVVRDVTQNFKHLRKTRHTHHPVDDAKGNAEALLTLKEQSGLKIPL
jgi:hypothetical protein